VYIFYMYIYIYIYIYIFDGGMDARTRVKGGDVRMSSQRRETRRK
jgi:hypothetical protein